MTVIVIFSYIFREKYHPRRHSTGGLAISGVPLRHWCSTNQDQGSVT